MSQHVTIIRMTFPETRHFFHYSILSPYVQEMIWARQVGMAREGLSKKVLEQFEVPLPPLAEQKRIVAKVDELMALCDELEARQTKRNETRVRLNNASLDALVNAQDPDEVAHHWSRLSETFELAYDTPACVQSLRHMILRLGIQGRLVPQDPHDEPASKLVARVSAEKLRLLQAKVIKSEKPMDPIFGKESLFPIPDNWTWFRAGNLCRPISSGSTPDKSVFHATEGIPYLKVYNIRNQAVDFDYKRQFIAAKHHEERMKRSKLFPGDVIMNIVGPPLGKVAIVPDTFPEWNCNQAISFFRPIFSEFVPYLYTFLRAGSFLQNIQLIGTAGQDNISVTKCKFIPISIPPLAEQKRIVAKVDELMTLCDALESKLTVAQATNQRLLDASIASLVA